MTPATDDEIAEVRRRLAVFKHPSFDRDTVERLILRLEEGAPPIPDEQSECLSQLTEARKVIEFYADREHWRTANVDGLSNTGYGLGYHRTGDGIMEVLGSNCGQWVPSKMMVHGGHWQADAGYVARQFLADKK
ncbi:hypothetical protein [Manganibacter manganicus]|uniref:Uncharacterized protein n=1 Tax=Manganibacter manganicus TaxID=1873176 RepID=A0A1V8RP12_9HYPH|nr:hypothetical protein [Pseudaminobacter manganicus]OQM74942.1 hypothetical protein BFN67_04830 [Pseudaminobacter manganicus]